MFVLSSEASSSDGLSLCVPQFSSVLQNVQALREQTLMLVHGTADGKVTEFNSIKLTASTRTHQAKAENLVMERKGNKCWTSQRKSFNREGLENMWCFYPDGV